MKLVVSAIAALAFTLASAAPSPADAAPKPRKSYAAKSAKVKSNGPLRGVIYGNQRRPGGYSYKYSDVIEPGHRSNPAVSGLYPSGPLDGDFFFATPRGPFGGYTPYMH